MTKWEQRFNAILLVVFVPEIQALCIDGTEIVSGPGEPSWSILYMSWKGGLHVFVSIECQPLPTSQGYQRTGSFPLG